MFTCLRMFTSFLVWAVWHGLDDTPCVGSFGVTILVLLHLSISTALMKLGKPNSTVCSYIHKEESVTSYSSFTLKAIIRMRVVYEKISVINCYELQFYCSIRYFFYKWFPGHFSFLQQTIHVVWLFVMIAEYLRPNGWRSQVAAHAFHKCPQNNPRLWIQIGYIFKAGSLY